MAGQSLIFIVSLIEILLSGQSKGSFKYKTKTRQQSVTLYLSGWRTPSAFTHSSALRCIKLKSLTCTPLMVTMAAQALFLTHAGICWWRFWWCRYRDVQQDMSCLKYCSVNALFPLLSRRDSHRFKWPIQLINKTYAFFKLHVNCFSFRLLNNIITSLTLQACLLVCRGNSGKDAHLQEKKVVVMSPDEWVITDLRCREPNLSEQFDRWSAPEPKYLHPTLERLKRLSRMSSFHTGWVLCECSRRVLGLQWQKKKKKHILKDSEDIFSVWCKQKRIHLLHIPVRTARSHKKFKNPPRRLRHVQPTRRSWACSFMHVKTAVFKKNTPHIHTDCFIM